MRIEVKSVVLKTPWIHAEGPYIDEPPSPPPPPALDWDETFQPQAEVPTSPHRPQCSPKKTRAHETQTSPTRRQRSPKQTRVQSVQTSPAYRRRSPKRLAPRRLKRQTRPQWTRPRRTTWRANRRHSRAQSPICAPTDEPLAEWEDGVLDQVLTEIQGTGWDGSFMEEFLPDG